MQKLCANASSSFKILIASLMAATSSARTLQRSAHSFFFVAHCDARFARNDCRSSSSFVVSSMSPAVVTTLTASSPTPEQVGTNIQRLYAMRLFCEALQTSIFEEKWQTSVKCAEQKRNLLFYLLLVMILLQVWRTFSNRFIKFGNC